MNVVDKFNKDGKTQATNMILAKYKSFELASNGDIIEKVNMDDSDPSFRWNGVGLMVEKPNGLKWKVGEKLTPFEILTRVKYKGNDSAAFNSLLLDDSENVKKLGFFRVGDKWYQRIKEKNAYGLMVDIIVPFNKGELKDDLGDPKHLRKLPKYRSFVLEPDNINYEQVIGGSYNRYHKSPYTPQKCESLDEIPNITFLMNHIFEEQIDLGWKYLQMLWCHPKHKLPIFCPVSHEQGTGKSTYIHFIQRLLMSNCAKISPKDLAKAQNDFYADKIMICLDESEIKDKAVLEEIKAMVTSDTITVDGKYLPQWQQPFHGHFTMASNDQDKFIRIAPNETRYWVRIIKQLKGKENPYIMQDIQKEIPKLIYLLENMPKIDIRKESKGRFFFHIDEYSTDALHSLKEKSKGGDYESVKITIDEWFQDHKTIEKVRFSEGEFRQQFFQGQMNKQVNWIKTILEDKLELKKKRVRGKYIWGNYQFEQNKVEPALAREARMRYEMINPYYDPNATVENDNDDDDMPF